MESDQNNQPVVLPSPTARLALFLAKYGIGIPVWMAAFILLLTFLSSIFQLGDSIAAVLKLITKTFMHDNQFLEDNFKDLDIGTVIGIFLLASVVLAVLLGMSWHNRDVARHAIYGAADATKNVFLRVLGIVGAFILFAFIGIEYSLSYVVEGYLIVWIFSAWIATTSLVDKLICQFNSNFCRVRYRSEYSYYYTRPATYSFLKYTLYGFLLVAGLAIFVIAVIYLMAFFHYLFFRGGE